MAHLSGRRPWGKTAQQANSKRVTDVPALKRRKTKVFMDWGCQRKTSGEGKVCEQMFRPWSTLRLAKNLGGTGKEKGQGGRAKARERERISKISEMCNHRDKS